MATTLHHLVAVKWLAGMSLVVASFRSVLWRLWPLSASAQVETVFGRNCKSKHQNHKSRHDWRSWGAVSALINQISTQVLKLKSSCVCFRSKGEDEWRVHSSDTISAQSWFWPHSKCACVWNNTDALTFRFLEQFKECIPPNVIRFLYSHVLYTQATLDKSCQGSWHRGYFLGK